ncbi:ABC-three component system middle component 6 [Oscillibacter sp.]|uniref:ABC-three component system middle component 6 n=1 Tax=Oscillibacter sp. TaxID=1945593 RepID=UPI0037C6557A
MILPKKQVSMYESYFGFGAFLLQHLSNPISPDELWQYYKDSYANNQYPIKFSFDQFIIALDYLYIIGAIRKNERGLLCYEAH